MLGGGYWGDAAAPRRRVPLKLIFLLKLMVPKLIFLLKLISLVKLIFLLKLSILKLIFLLKLTFLGSLNTEPYQCSAVDTGETLLHLAAAFQEALVNYVEGLHKHVVPPDTPPSCL